MATDVLHRQPDQRARRRDAPARPVPAESLHDAAGGPVGGGPVRSPALRPAQRIWLQKDEAPPFGREAYELLLCVAESGSLTQAAKRAGVSYSKALHLVKEAEECLGVRLFERRVGGTAGGGSTLTADGRKLGERFGALLLAADTELARLYDQYFGDLSFAGQRRGAGI